MPPAARRGPIISVCFDGGADRDPRRRAGRGPPPPLFPIAAWRLVRVGVEEVGEVRRGLPAARLAGLLRPARTVMDRNIGAAL